MEGCWRCDRNRTRLGTDGIAEDDRAGQTCWRSIGDQYLTQIYDGSYAERLSRTVFPKYQKGNRSVALKQT